MSAWSSIAAGIGGAFGFANNQATNKANLQIARETNASQERMFNQQLDWNLAQWERNNEYNTPTAQMQRYRDAGLNPYLMMNGGAAGSGNSSAPASGVNPPQQHTATMQPDTSIKDSLMKMAEFDYNKRLMDAEASNKEEDAKGKVIDNMTRSAENAARIEELTQRVSNGKARQDLDKIELQLKRATFNDSVVFAKLQNKSLEEQNELTHQSRLGVILDNDLKNMKNANYPAEFAANLAYVWSQVGLNKAMTATQVSEQKKLAQDVVESVARSAGIRLDNGVKFKLQSSLVKEGQARADRAAEEAENVFYFGIPNPSYTIDNNLSVGGKFGIGTNESGYGNIRDAKDLAKKLHPRGK